MHPPTTHSSLLKKVTIPIMNLPSRTHFKMHKISLAPFPGNFIPHQKAAEFLMRGASMTTTPFEWTIIDKPADGTMILFHLPAPQTEIPEDGFGWMDDETFQKITLENGMELDIFTRMQGFGNGESSTQVKRKRFRLSRNPEYQLVQFIRLPNDLSTVPIQMGSIKVRPRMPNSLPMNPASSVRPGGVPIPIQNAQRPIQQQKPVFQAARQTSQVKIMDEERELPGDPLDEASARSIAYERYRKNHAFAELLFAPVPAVNHVKPVLFTDVSSARLDEILERNKVMEAELEELRNANQKKLLEFKSKSQHEWKKIHDLLESRS